VEAVADEIARGQPVLLVEQALIKAQAKDSVPQTQERLIGEPVIERLQAECGPDGAERLLLALLEGWRNRPAEEVGYGPGNVINLMRLLRGELRGLDLSQPIVRQASMQGVDVQDASLANAHVSESMFGEAFGAVSSIPVAGRGDVHWGRVAVAGGAPHASLGGAGPALTQSAA
jgi:hypothetical protein